MKNKFFIIATLSVLAACGPEKDRKGKELDSSSTGSTRISIDETFAPIMDEEIEAYQNANPDTKILPTYGPETSCIVDLMSDSSVVAIISRPLLPQEQNYFDRMKINPKVTRICRDGIALITSKNSKLENISKEDVLKILKGEIRTWDKLGLARKDSIRLVFDNKGSSTINYFADQIKPMKPGIGVFAVQTNKEVISYVETHESAIGFIGVNWISNTDDSTTQKFRENIKVLGVSDKDSTGKKLEPVKPYQLYLANGTYPFSRDIYAINCEGRMGLGTGFVNYLCNDKGQAILRMAGLVPLRHVIKKIEVKTLD